MANFHRTMPKTVTPEWSEKCFAFLQHWNGIRDGKPMPTTEAMLNTMPPRYVSAAYIVEITDKESIVRFQGADLIAQWGVDRTGLDIAAHRSVRLQAQIHAINSTVVHHFCGYISQTTYATSRHRVVDVAVIRLPLAVRDGRLPRVIACIDETFAGVDGDRSWEVYEVLGHGWIDIGAGVPHLPPDQIIE